MPKHSLEESRPELIRSNVQSEFWSWSSWSPGVPMAWFVSSLEPPLSTADTLSRTVPGLWSTLNRYTTDMHKHICSTCDSRPSESRKEAVLSCQRSRAVATLKGGEKQYTCKAGHCWGLEIHRVQHHSRNELYIWWKGLGMKKGLSRIYGSFGLLTFPLSFCWTGFYVSFARWCQPACWKLPLYCRPFCFLLAQGLKNWHPPVHSPSPVLHQPRGHCAWQTGPLWWVILLAAESMRVVFPHKQV